MKRNVLILLAPLVVAEDWEVPATLNNTWGFKKDDTNWKPPSDLASVLCLETKSGTN
jgi:alpha-L-fucosidase